MALSPAVFLDKDGTVLQDVPYNVDPDKMVFAPGAAEALALLGKSGLPLFIITNQPGIALGLFGVEALAPMQRRLEDMFAEAGARLSGLYFCPHHPEGTQPDFSRRCQCRKPAPGLLMTAAAQHNIDLSCSWMVGDILDDIEAGRRSGCGTILIDNGNETEWAMNEWRGPDHRVADLLAASRLIADSAADSTARARSAELSP